MISVQVTDPLKEISAIYLEYDSPDCVVLMIDTIERYQEIHLFSGFEVYVGKEACVELKGAAFDKPMIGACTIDKHSILVTYLNPTCAKRSIKEPARILYLGE